MQDTLRQGSDARRPGNVELAPIREELEQHGVPVGRSALPGLG